MLAGLSLQPAEDLRIAAAPLFADGLVDCLEWAPDLVRPGRRAPEWCRLLLAHYADAGRVHGHGVRGDLFAADRDDERDGWFAQLAQEAPHLHFRTFSEHLGFMSVEGFACGAPLPLPPLEAVRDRGVAGLRELRELLGCPVGLENLALAFSEEQLWEQGPLLEALLAPVDGYLVLDLHNLHCQCANFAVPPEDLLTSLPLGRVRELHVAGGSSHRTRAAPGQPLRRDTHDQPVPEAVYELLATALARCPGVELVIFEHMAGTLGDSAAQEAFRGDFRRLRALLQELGDAG